MEKPLPRDPDLFFLDLVTQETSGGASKETVGISQNEPRKAIKPFPHRGEAKKKKDDLMDFMEIFERLEINLPFLQALKLSTFSKFIKEFIAGKTKPEGKIVIGENVSAVIQKRRLP